MVRKETKASDPTLLEAEGAEGLPLEELAELLPPARLPPGGLTRLLEEVEKLPRRYAPFFGRLATLWDLSEAEVEATLEQARDEKAWKRTLLPGLRRLSVKAGPALADAEVSLLRFPPGARFPAHRHAGTEVVFVLEGSYVDGTKRRVGPGDQQVLDAGTEHTLEISADGPCVATIVSRGTEFTGWLLGSLQKLWPER